MRELINLISENEQPNSSIAGARGDLQDIEKFTIDHPESESYVQQQLQKLLTYTNSVLNKLKLHATYISFLLCFIAQLATSKIE